MLSLVDENLSRRSFLRIGSLGLGGLTLPRLLAAEGSVARGHPSFVTGKSVIFLFMHGGPGQTETFDPKMTAPAGIRSLTGEVKTSVPGVTFGATFPKLARLAHKLTVVRSFKTGDGRHDIKPIVGRESDGANLGSIYARLAGTNHPVTAMPTNVALFPRSIDAKTQARNTNFGKFRSTGSLGEAYAPFIPGGGGDLQRDMELTLNRERLDDRRELLIRLDRMRRALDGSSTLDGLDHFQEQAFDTILGGVAKAFDLEREDRRTIERYDTAPLVPPETVSTRWNNHKNYKDNAKTLGKLLLLARRLCEAGCRFVTVTTNFVWDMHADQNNATMEEGMRYVGVPFDHAVSAFIQDCEERGLRDDILLVACGEMGRTPRVNKRGGRDHWGGLSPLLLYGGGLPMGQVIGRSTADAGEPASDPVSIRDLVATIVHTQFDVAQLRVLPGLPKSIEGLVANARPIPGLI